MIRLTIDLDVTNEPALRAYAAKRVAAAWKESLADLTDGSVANFALEALVLSNENPSPADYGIDIVGATAVEL